MFRRSRDVTAKELVSMNGPSIKVPRFEPNVAQWIACIPFAPMRIKQEPSGVENTLRGTTGRSTWAGLHKTSNYFVKGVAKCGNSNLNCSVINEKMRPRPVSSSRKISSLPDTKQAVRNTGASYQGLRLIRLPRDERLMVDGSKTKTSRKT
jgi:hypothetical protein